VAEEGVQLWRGSSESQAGLRRVGSPAYSCSLYELDFRMQRTTCWTCGLPGDRCEIYSPQRIKCRWRDFVVSVLVYVSVIKDIGYRDVIQKVLKRDLSELLELTVALVRNG